MMVEIDVSDTIQTATGELVIASILTGQPLDVIGSGRLSYRTEYMLPTVTRTGERFRKDEWARRRRWG